VITTALLGALAASAAAAGDAYWAQRSAGMSESVADPAPIRAAVRAYAAALEEEPGDLETRWKLLRALHFEGEFATLEPAARRSLFDRARKLSDEGLWQLQSRIGEVLHELPPRRLRASVEAAGLDASEVARVYYWAAANWGSWSKEVGLLEAVRSGVANRLRVYLELVVVLEPEYEAGGAHRFLGALHARLPSVPLISGWVDREQAVPQLETALAIAPAEPSNRLLLGLTLLELEPAQRNRGLRVLAEVAETELRPERRVEDAVVIREAMRRLEREKEEDRST
jgi:hypothetical protein